MKQEKAYTLEQISDARKLSELLNSVSDEQRAIVRFGMMAYMNGIETGIMCAQQDGLMKNETMNKALYSI